MAHGGAHQWWHEEGGLAAGPVSTEQLREWLDSGALTSGSRIAAVGSDQWVTVNDMAQELGLGESRPQAKGYSASPPAFDQQTPPFGKARGDAQPDIRPTTPFPLPPPSNAKRLAAALLEAVLLVVTVFIGWMVWSILIWPDGLTPAKQLLGLRVMNVENRQPATGGQMAIREIVGKGVIGLFTCGIGPFLLSGIMILLHDSRQGLWDRIAKTAVIEDRDRHGVPSAETPTSIPRRPQQIAGMWVLFLVVVGCFVGLLPVAGAPTDDSGCPLTSRFPPVAVVLWIGLVAISVVGAIALRRQDQRLTAVAIVGGVSGIATPVATWIMSYNPCWA